MSSPKATYRLSLVALLLFTACAADGRPEISTSLPSADTSSAIVQPTETTARSESTTSSSVEFSTSTSGLVTTAANSSNQPSTSSLPPPETTTSTSRPRTTTSTSRPRTTKSTSRPRTTSSIPPKEHQFITFDGWSRPLYVAFSEPFGATSTSGLAIEYVLVDDQNGACKRKSDRLETVTIPGDGRARFPATCVVEARQAGNERFLPAQPVRSDLTIERANVAITFVSEKSTNSDGTEWTVKLRSSPAGIASEVIGQTGTPTACPLSSVGSSNRTDYSIKVTIKPGAECRMKFGASGDRISNQFEAGSMASWTKQAPPPAATTEPTSTTVAP